MTQELHHEEKLVGKSLHTYRYTLTYKLAGKAVDFALLHHNNTNLGKVYVLFSIKINFSVV